MKVLLHHFYHKGQNPCDTSPLMTSDYTTYSMWMLFLLSFVLHHYTPCKMSHKNVNLNMYHKTNIP